jgi:chromosome partitioning protein
VIAVANQKGGVGKTTTAINLGASLGVAERPTLLVDVDAQANATSGLGLEVDEGRPGLYEVMIGRVGIRDAVVKTEVPFLDAVPSTPSLAGAEVELVSEIGRELILRRALDEVRESYDYIILDCPPSLGILTVNALVAADSVLIPIQCEYYALEGLGRFLKTVQLVQRSLNPDLAVEGVLLTMFDSRLNLASQVADETRKHFPDKVYDTVVPRNVRLSEAPSFGKPIVLYDILSAGARSYLNLAKEMIQRESIREEVVQHG